MRRIPLAGLAALLIVGAVACSDDSGDDGGDSATTSAASTAATTAPDGSAAPESSAATSDVTLTLLAHDSFSPSEGVFDSFTAATGIKVQIAQGGDAGELVSKAVLTAGNPEGDVLFGVDNTLLSRAVDADVFVPYESAGLTDVPAAFSELASEHEVTPIDYGDVCVNYDIAALQQRGVDPPQTLDDLVDPQYRDMLVTENVTTSSPGLAFLLATVGAKGDGWQQYWKDLRANGVKVVDDWTQAYYEEFSHAGGDRPLVVSYASSPPVEVLYADPPLAEGSPAPTGVASGTCFRQVEFAGVLRGTEHEAEAQQLVDFLLSPTFQADMPLTMFVYPVNDTVPLPELFTEYATTIDTPFTVDPADIDANRQQWIDEWTTTVLR